MSLKQIYILFTFALLVTSCFEYKKPERPENLMSKEQMVEFLIDLKLMSFTFNPIDAKRMESLGVNSIDYVYKKHNIDSLQFELSHDYYTYYSDDYEEIYTRVIDSLQRLKNYYQNKTTTSNNIETPSN